MYANTYITNMGLLASVGTLPTPIYPHHRIVHPAARALVLLPVL